MSSFRNEYGDIKGSIKTFSTIFGLLCFLTVIKSCHTVKSGERGIKITLGKVEDTSLQEGLYWKIPYIQIIETMDVKKQKMVREKVSCTTKNLQNADINFALTYSLDPAFVPKIYKTIGREYSRIIIEPAILGTLKDEIGRWEAQELTSKRTQCAKEVTRTLSEKLKDNHIIIYNFELQNIEFEPNFYKAIEAKVIAHQKFLEQEFITKQKQEQAQQFIIGKKAEAEGITLKATAEAAAIQMRSEALSKNPQALIMEAIYKWNGELPTTVIGNTQSILDVSKFISTPKKVEKPIIHHIIAEKNNSNQR